MTVHTVDRARWSITAIFLQIVAGGVYLPKCKGREESIRLGTSYKHTFILNNVSNKLQLMSGDSKNSSKNQGRLGRRIKSHR